MKDFSIIILTYKSADVIEKNLASILSQKMPSSNYEVILVDDNSNDGTGKIAEQIAKKNDKIKLYLMKKRRGNSYCKNHAVRMSEGKYLYFLDDHLFLPRNDVLYDMYYALKNSKDNIVGVCGNYLSPGKKDHNIYRDIRRFMLYGKRDDDLLITPDRFIPFSIVISILRRDNLNKAGSFSQGYLTNAAEDTYFQLHQHKKHRNFLYLAKAKGYHSHNASFLDTITKIKRELLGYTCILAKFSRDKYFNKLYLPSFLSFPLLFYLSLVATILVGKLWPLLVLSICLELLLFSPVFYYKAKVLVRIKTVIYCFASEILKGPVVLCELVIHPSIAIFILNQLFCWEVSKIKYIYENRFQKSRPYKIIVT
jgi:glycosyltransferase involved in cell wall biosynthesis